MQASWAHPDKMPTGGSATTRMEDGKEVPWPYEPWMLTARAVYQRRQEKEGVVIKAAVVAKLEADDKRAADAVARVRAMLLTVPKGSEQHESLKTELAVKQAELAAATAARKCKGKPAEKDQADADADGAGPSKPEKGDRTSGIMRCAALLLPHVATRADTTWRAGRRSIWSVLRTSWWTAWSAALQSARERRLRSARRASASPRCRRMRSCRGNRCSCRCSCKCLQRSTRQRRWLQRRRRRCCGKQTLCRLTNFERRVVD